MLHIIAKTNAKIDHIPIVWHYPTSNIPEEQVAKRIRQFIDTMAYYKVDISLHVVFAGGYTFGHVQKTDDRFTGVHHETQLDDLIRAIMYDRINTKHLVKN